MNDGGTASRGAAASLRAAFDAAFAEPASAVRPQTVALLVVRVGGETCALRTAELRGVERDRRVVPMPSTAPGFVGLAGVRGELLPVFRLATLLGHAVADRAAPWLLVAAGDARIALAVEAVETWREVAPDALVPAADAGPEGSEPIREVAALDGAVLRVVSVAAVVAAVQAARGG